MSRRGRARVRTPALLGLTAAVFIAGAVVGVQSGWGPAGERRAAGRPPKGQASASGRDEPPTLPPEAARAALSRLESLPTAERAPKTGYTRAAFGQRWADVDRNGCDTRNDVLRRDLDDATLKPGTRGCVVLAGRLLDPYTGQVIDFEKRASEAVQIDHVVSLSNAWQTGAQALTPEAREAFANDPANLLAVDGPTNEAKGDSDAADWLPPRRAFRCEMVALQVEVKARHHLWVTPRERDAMRDVLTSCAVGAPPN